jgi:outer membrane protein OmpA-like peptidoglycan-associated protein
MDRNNRANEAKKSQQAARRTAAAPVSEGLKPETAMSEAAGAVQRAKSAATPPLNPADILALQRSMGNKAVQRMLAHRPAPAGVQKHWMPGEQEEVQAMPLVQRHWMPGEQEEVQAKPAGQQMPISRAFGDSRYARRKAEGRDVTNRRLWQNNGLIQRQDPPGAAPPATEEKKEVVTLDPVTFAPNEIPADGKTTSQANVKTSPTGRTIKWSIDGEGFGSNVNDTGLVTPGTDTQGKEKVELKVRAADDKTGSASAGMLTLWDAKFFQAKKDYPTFIGSTYKVPNYKPYNFGRFDVEYNPSGNVVNATMRVKFDFPDDPIPQPGVGNLWGWLNQADVAAAKARHDTYINNFKNTVITQWSGRYQFKNVREPQSIWGKLTPVSVKVNIEVVDSNQHFLINAYTKKAGTANVTSGGVATFFKGNDVPQPKFNPGTAAGELTRVRRNTPSPVLFANNDAAVPADAQAKLQFLGTYISRINNPKFDIKIIGHASATGDSAKNLPLSQQRADNVAAALKSGGTGAHNITVSAVGDAGAAKTDDWRKVEIASDIPAGWQNLQDVTAHEFGHMIGLDDEYAAGRGPLAEHHDLVAKAFGKEYADQVAKAGDTDYASVMEGGNDVRIQHYVTFWEGLVKATETAAVPDPKFTYDDWKFIG